MNNLDNHYLTLGLQHGATQEEIHAAFQRMSVKYHPDNDSSLDAEMKFHEARQAYAALTKPAEPTFTPPEPPNATRSQTSEPPPNSRTREQASGFSNATSGARQQTTDNHGTAGFTLNPSGAKKNRAEFYEAVRNHPDLKEVMTGYRGEDSEESKVFSDFPMHDYFHRLKVVLAVIGSIVVLFIAMRYITQLSFRVSLHESSVRLFLHIAAFLLVSWPIFWYVRFTDPTRGMAYIVIGSLGVVYACWMYFMTLPQEIAEFWALPWHMRPRRYMPISMAGGFFINFCAVFYFAIYSLEKEGMADAFARVKRKFIRSHREEERRW